MAARSCGGSLRVGPGRRCRNRPPAHRRDQSHRHDEHPAEHHGRQWRNLGFELELLQPPLQACLQAISPLARLRRIEPGVRLTRLLLELELFGAVIPVGDLLDQADP